MKKQINGCLVSMFVSGLILLICLSNHEHWPTDDHARPIVCPQIILADILANMNLS